VIFTFGQRLRSTLTNNAKIAQACNFRARDSASNGIRCRLFGFVLASNFNPIVT
jgi:hypothetical protein